MATSTADYTYTGKINPEKETGEDFAGTTIYPYLPDDDLVEAVNLAIALDRPLLLEGDPGCGKTCLAEALAYELGKNNNVTWPYYRWDVKSSTRGKDGLYTFDAVGRLRDAQMLGANLTQLGEFLDEKDLAGLKTRLKNKRKYLDFGALGKAIKEVDRRAIVLIDEVDKADSDFANDLLLEFDRFTFKIPEINETESYPEDPQKAKKPIVILTSNREKPLPAPFLRRCIYFYVQFPQGDRLYDIVQRRFGKIPKNQETLIRLAIDKVELMRELLSGRPGSRPPGTSEFLDFLAALLKRKNGKADLETLADRPPLLGILLKTEADQKLYRQRSKK
jgi:MoxR-like ATPase